MSSLYNMPLTDRLNRALAAWKQLRPTKKFGGRTAEQFELELHKAAQARAQLAEAERMYDHYKHLRDVSNREMSEALQCVVNSIKGDPSEGPDGELYIACGYVPRSERRRALRKPRNDIAAGPAEPTAPRAAA